MAVDLSTVPDREDATPALRKAADAAWARYQSSVVLGGTPAQRRWAFEAAVKAEDAVIRDRWAQGARLIGA